jgi:hypothetical protein
VRVHVVVVAAQRAVRQPEQASHTRAR